MKTSLATRKLPSPNAKAKRTVTAGRQCSVAHVGHTGTLNDFKRIAEVIEWCGKHGQEIGKGDFFNLSKGRDFLREDKKYEVVVLHFIFRGGFGVNNSKHPELGLSPLASWSNWRKRLVDSGAKWIFAYGGMAEVGGTYIVNLDGYRVHKVRTEELGKTDRCDQQEGLWVFEKE
jgi:hypothetical protein